MLHLESSDIMRLRNLKDKDILLENCNYLVKNPEEYKGKWHELFFFNYPFHIEIGMGKGNFIIENAKRYPHINFIGIEKYDSVLVRAIEKLEGIELSNLKLIRMDATEIEEVFDHEVDTIYLNFSDPWPKNRHHLRRLSSKVFLEKYETIFLDDKDIWMRTDNASLFCYSLMSFSEAGYVLRNLTFDLHQNIPDDFITTEYEDRFSNKGMPIYSVEAVKVSNKVKM